MTCYLLDRNKTWKECWCDIDGKMDVDTRLSTPYMDVDVCDPNSYAPFAKYLKADLFTFVYFISEIFAKRDCAQPFFDHLFDSVKPGGMLLFIDNNDSRFFGWFDGMAKSNDMEVLKEASGRYVIPGDEQCADLEEYFSIFGSPKVQGNIASRVVRRRTQ